MAFSGLTSLAARAQGGLEIDPNEIMHKPVGHHLPLRPMKVENGTLYYEEGTEVAVYGVNYQTIEGKKKLAWKNLEIDFSKFAGQTINLELYNNPVGDWTKSYAAWKSIDIVSE